MPWTDDSADPLTVALERSGPISDACSRESSTFAMLTGRASKLVVFGCGIFGSWVAEAARVAGIEIVGFADNNPDLWGREKDGVLITSPADAMAAHNQDAYFVVGVFNGSGPRAQLAALGCTRIVPFAAFYWAHSESFQRQTGFELPHKILERETEIRDAYSCLGDAKSRREFSAQIGWRCTLAQSLLPDADDPSGIYFPTDLVALGRNEVLVDCGAFDGDSLRLFLDKTFGEFKGIYACEPDPENRRAFETKLAAYPATVRDRVSLLPFAVSDRDGWIRFDLSGTAGSHISEDPTAKTIEARCLDGLLEAETPTFIKMDIEGAEPDAISGAAKTLRRARPVLAVCAYHRCEHLWTLPLLIRSIVPDYRIFLRRYAEDCWETVYYALPRERPWPKPENNTIA